MPLPSYENDQSEEKCPDSNQGQGQSSRTGPPFVCAEPPKDALRKREEPGKRCTEDDGAHTERDQEGTSERARPRRHNRKTKMPRSIQHLPPRTTYLVRLRSPGRGRVLWRR